MEGDQENIFLESKSCESALTECLDSLQLSDKESGSKTFIAQPDPDTIKLFIGQVSKVLQKDWIVIIPLGFPSFFAHSFSGQSLIT